MMPDDGRSPESSLSNESSLQSRLSLLIGGMKPLSSLVLSKAFLVLGLQQARVRHYHRKVHLKIPDLCTSPESLRQEVEALLSETASNGFDEDAAEVNPAFSASIHGQRIRLETVLDRPDGGDPENLLARHRLEWLRPLVLLTDREPLNLALNNVLKGVMQQSLVSDPYSRSSRIVLLTQILSHCGLSSHKKAWHLLVERELVLLAESLEYHGYLTNNHLLNNARALIVGGCFIDATWAVDAGVRILEIELPKRLENGYLNEGSAHYHFVVVRWLIDVWLALVETGDDRAVSFMSTFLIPMLQAGSSLLDPSGHVIPLMGDVSPDWSPAELVPFPGKDRDVGSLWTHYKIIAPKSFNKIIAELKRSKTNPGVPSIKRGNGVAWLNTPRQNHQVHGHLDLAQVCLAMDGQLLIHDKGRPSYTGTEALSGKDHNAPSIDRCFPIDISKDSFKRLGTSRLWRRFADRVNVESDSRLSAIWSPIAGAQVTRSIEALEGGWRIRDEVICTSEHEYHSTWFLPTETRLQQKHIYELVPGIILEVRGVAPAGLSLCLDSISTSYGTTVSACRLDITVAFSDVVQVELVVRRKEESDL